MAAYTVNDVLVKQILLQHYPVGETIFLRGMISALLIGGFVLALGHAPQMRAAMSRLLAARSVCDGLSTACFIAALAQMPLANIAAVLQIGPLLITVLSVLFYREAVGWRRWTAIGVGFFGALLVIKPLPSAFDIWAVVGAGSALFAALREMQNRSIDRAVPTLVIAFWGAVAITRSARCSPSARTGGCSRLGDLIRLFVASVFVGIAIYLMALAFRDVDLSVVAPFRYSYLITSAVARLSGVRRIAGRLDGGGRGPDRSQRHLPLHREAVRRRQLDRQNHARRSESAAKPRPRRRRPSTKFQLTGARTHQISCNARRGAAATGGGGCVNAACPAGRPEGNWAWTHALRFSRAIDAVNYRFGIIANYLVLFAALLSAANAGFRYGINGLIEHQPRISFPVRHPDADQLVRQQLQLLPGSAMVHVRRHGDARRRLDAEGQRACAGRSRLRHGQRPGAGLDRPARRPACS